VSEQQAEQTSGEPGSLRAGPATPHSSDARSQQSAPEVVSVDSPKLAPGQGAAAEAAAPGADASRAEAPKPDAPRIPGKAMIVSSGNPKAESEPGRGMFGKRRLAALAAVVVLSVAAGALGGALGTAGLPYFVGDDASSAGNHALEASVARIDADLLALKASLEQVSQTETAQFSKASDRLDKVEKAQAEPAAKLARLSEAVDRLRAASPVAPAAAAATPVAAKEVTGSISPPAAVAPAAPPKPEVARLPKVEGWVLRDVGNGGALIEGRQGIYEVYAGDAVPGLGRVDAIRRQDGRWVVVTSKGLIGAR